MAAKLVYDASVPGFRPVRVTMIERPNECWACGDPVLGTLVITCSGCGEQMPGAPGWHEH